jgi:hypothetical protein
MMVHQGLHVTLTREGPRVEEQGGRHRYGAESVIPGVNYATIAAGGSVGGADARIMGRAHHKNAAHGRPRACALSVCCGVWVGGM